MWIYRRKIVNKMKQMKRRETEWEYCHIHDVHIWQENKYTKCLQKQDNSYLDPKKKKIVSHISALKEELYHL